MIGWLADGTPGRVNCLSGDTHALFAGVPLRVPERGNFGGQHSLHRPLVQDGPEELLGLLQRVAAGKRMPDCGVSGNFMSLETCWQITIHQTEGRSCSQEPNVEYEPQWGRGL